MMTECRRYAPDLILLNHRLGLERARAYATTFLWEGRETYIGAPDRAAAFPSNTWEYVNAKRDRGYTYYFPITPEMR